MLRIIILILLVAPALFIASCSSGDASEQVAQVTTHVNMPESTAIAVTLVDSIDTDVHVTGTEFRAKLSKPIIVSGYTVFPDGAAVKGILSRVVESGRLKTPAELDFSLTSIQNSSGRWIDVSTHTIMDKMGSHTNREVAMIGGGAIVGGIIGKIINRDGSTEIGAAAGAAAGTGMAAATGKRDIFYGMGSEIVFFSDGVARVALN
ncbi:MAG: hypothetical protein C4532_09265 [Candidatus Abyssobacteria bacterium SURF_17]|uniref:Glycine zipper 2TM domain-containing protein n=1 Tax=Candidatus Abyssobacteria bacterium SURF_17 TaxID=2093361 RepID=A0A419EZ43_9BACT|nr:MAG: hypothetical protein C4532_09265 [Candidatus Abyssubacteria bacterium SURF_17]